VRSRESLASAAAVSGALLCAITTDARQERSKCRQNKKASKLDQYKEYITELLQEHRDPPITNQRILELIREKGYQGGRTILGDYLGTLRDKNTKEPVFCVETSPGEMGSHDWSEYYVYFSETGKKQKVIFSASY